MGTLTMKRLPATFLTVNKTAPGTETSVLLLTRDEELSRRIDHELGGSYELVPCESLAVLQEQKQLHKPRAVLVHMSESTLDGATPAPISDPLPAAEPLDDHQDHDHVH